MAQILTTGIIVADKMAVLGRRGILRLLDYNELGCRFNCGLVPRQVPLVKSYLAKFAAQSVGGDVISLAELAAPMAGGRHYPLFLLCLQQLHKVRDDKSWLVSVFNKSKIDLQEMLPGACRLYCPQPQYCIIKPLSGI